MRAPSWTGILVIRTTNEERSAIQGGMAAESVALDVPMVPRILEKSAAEDMMGVEADDLG